MNKEVIVMNKEDYFKYYIQGSDHYLIPKDVFNELFDEMSNWIEEAKELKKQLEEINKFKFSYRKDETKIPPIIRKQKDVEIIKNLKNQQKEFIEYMNKTIEELECDDVDDEEMKGYLIQRIDTFKEILSKFKKIIGSDINVGSKGGKDE